MKRRTSAAYPYIRSVGAALFAILIMAGVSSCKKDPKPEPADDTVTLNVDWSNRGEGIAIPAEYYFGMGDYSSTFQAAENVIDAEFAPGKYNVKVHNDAGKITIEGSTATVESSSGVVDTEPGWLFSWFREVTREKGKRLEIKAVMEQQVRELELTIIPDMREDEEFTGIEATISGIASAIDLETKQAVGQPATAKPVFEKQSDGSYKAKVKLLGTAGSEQIFATTVTVTGESDETYEIGSDMSVALNGFNSDKAKPLKLQATLFAPRNRDYTLSGWSDPDNPDLSTDITDKFTDPLFKDWVKENCADGRDRILISDVYMVPSVNVIMSDIASLAGIEYFTGLGELNCTSTKVTELDVSANKALKVLYCASLGLNSLDVSANTELTFLGCAQNDLTTLDLSKNTKLEGLATYHNPFTTLDLSKNTELKSLLHNESSLEGRIDLSANTKLEEIYLQKNSDLTEIILPQTETLTVLHAYEDGLATLDVSKNPELVMLFISDNNIGGILDLSANLKLKEIYCDKNQITELVLPQSTTPVYMFASENKLKSLNISANTGFKFIGIDKNPGELKEGTYVFTLTVWNGFSNDIFYIMPWQYDGHEVTVDFIQH